MTFTFILYIFHLHLYNEGCFRLKSYIRFITPLCCPHYVGKCPVECHLFCSVLTTFPVFCICCAVLPLHAVTRPIKCVIIYLSPLSLKIIVCPLVKAQRTQYEPPVTVPTICGLCFASCLQHKNISRMVSAMETQRIGVRFSGDSSFKMGESIATTKVKIFSFLPQTFIILKLLWAAYF